MFAHRKQVEVASLQNTIKEKLFSAYKDLDITNLDEALLIEKSIDEELGQILDILKDEKEENYFKAFYFLFKSLNHLFSWAQKELSGDDNALNEFKAAVNKSLVAKKMLIKFDGRPSVIKMNLLIEEISKCSDIFEVSNLAKQFCNIPLMVVHKIISDPFKYRKNIMSSTESEVDEKVEVVSALFYIEDEIWANPQILKPNINYNISGEIKVKNWKNSYQLLLDSVSTTDDSWYILSLAKVLNVGENTFQIQGNIIFKYSQNFKDKPHSIKLLCTIQRNDGENFYPTLIGFDHLKVRILDKATFPYPTGYNKLNEKLFHLHHSLNTELPELDTKEVNDFFILLSNILNYQGYCNQYGIYKKTDKLLEDEFRDQLIQHLVAKLGEEIHKEPHLAGGRVEILYRGISVELKVEKKISDRKKLKNKYGQQPLTYASATLKNLSILCILDLTKKDQLPQNLASENIFLIEPKFHGFNQKDYKTSSRLIMIVIDGNTINPSDYSKKIE